MNHRLLFHFLAGFALLVGVVRASEKNHYERDSIRLLTIGNSFAENALQNLPAIAKAGGKELIVFRANIAGSALDQHARHLRQAYAGEPAGRAYKNVQDPIHGGPRRDFTLPEALELAPWDVVTIQQVSSQSHRRQSYEPHARQLIEAIRKHAPTAEIIIHQTWAYRADHEFYRDGSMDPERMHAGLRDSYLQLAKRHGLRLLPSGDAFHLANNSPGWRYAPDPEFDYANPPAGVLPRETTLYMGARWRKDGATGESRLVFDSSHANAAGSYLAGVVWYLTLFNVKVAPDDYHPSSLTKTQADELREFARQAVLNASNAE